MVLWNRLIVSLLALFGIAAGVITVLVATGAMPPDFLPGGRLDGDAQVQGSWFQSQLEDLAAYQGSAKVTAVAIALAVAATTLALLLMQVTPGSKAVSLLISITGDGGLSMEDESVRYLSERTGLSNRHITDLRCRVAVRGRRTLAPARIIITCYPRVTLGSNVQEIRDDLQQRVKVTVENLTGLQVIRVDVARVRYERNDAAKLMGA